MTRGGLNVLILVAASLFFIFITYNLRYSYSPSLQESVIISKENYVGKDAHYDRFMPLIFIGGYPRSGTTLMRSMMDAHPQVRCGQETTVIPQILLYHKAWMWSESRAFRLEEAGITNEVLDAAVTSFILEIITRHGEPAERLCNKEPMNLLFSDYLASLFPNSKFIFMIRDGRASIHSEKSLNLEFVDFRQSMMQWNIAIKQMYEKCQLVGQSRCMIVYYEQLVLHPSIWLKKILSFLDVPWDDAVLHHEDYINKPGGVFLSKVEVSSLQVIKPVHTESLTKWVGNIPEDVVRDMASIAPMLERLGYDPNANPPKYGEPDSMVVENTAKPRRFISCTSVLAGVNKRISFYGVPFLKTHPHPNVLVSSFELTV